MGNLSVLYQTVSLSVCLSVNKSVRWVIKQPVSYSVSLSVNHKSIICLPTSVSVRLCLCLSICQSVSKSVSLCAKKPVSYSVLMLSVVSLGCLSICLPGGFKVGQSVSSSIWQTSSCLSVLFSPSIYILTI